MSVHVFENQAAVNLKQTHNKHTHKHTTWCCKLISLRICFLEFRQFLSPAQYALLTRLVWNIGIGTGNCVTSRVFVCKTEPIFLYLCMCQAWSVTLRNGCSLRVLQDGILRKIFGPEREELTGDWRKLHNGELCVL
jgi:hypothetical protein